MKDKAVLAPTCHKFSSLAIDPSSSKNTVSCLFTVVTSYLPELCQSCSMVPHGSCAKPDLQTSILVPPWGLSVLLAVFDPLLSEVSSIGQPAEM